MAGKPTREFGTRKPVAIPTAAPVKRSHHVALLLMGLPAWSQGLPDGKGKELAEANCNSCHTLLSRVGAGYTPRAGTPSCG